MTPENLAEYTKIMATNDNDAFKNLRISPESIDQHDKQIINNINSRVKEEDFLYFLGDFCFNHSKEAPNGSNFQYYRQQINCKNIICVKGNHDKRSNGFDPIIESMVIRHGGSWIKLIHNPDSRFVETKYDLILAGHVHQNWQFKRFKEFENFVDVINVGIDVWKYYPVSINEILSKYNRWKKTQENYNGKIFVS